jgi:hypothetical protein
MSLLPPRLNGWFTPLGSIQRPKPSTIKQGHQATTTQASATGGVIPARAAAIVFIIQE